MRWCSLLCLGLLAMAGFTGCNKGSGPAPTKIEIPKTPEGTVMTVSNAIGNGKFEVIWQAMPESYQGKIKHLLEELAEHTDAEVYNKGMTVVGKFVKVLSDKQEYILGTELMKQQIASGKTTKEEAKDALTAFSGLLGDLQKDIKTKDDLEKLNVEKYLANIGSRVKAIEPILAKNSQFKLGEEMEKLTKIKATAKDVSTDSATVEITDADGKVTTDTMVRVEGKWVPKKMADELPKKLDELGEQLHHSAEMSAEQKAQFMMGANMADGFLDTMLKASSQKEFNDAIAPILLMTGGMGGGMPQPQ